MRRIIKLFDRGNVSVCGMRGTGKDMLFANVAIRRKKQYISNTDYGGDRLEFVPALLNCNNSYNDFIQGKVKHYVYPYRDGTDFYIADAGVYFPSHYCNELNKQYGFLPTFVALSRHLGECNVHYNVQNLNRVWDKIREQSDTYIMCKWCIVFCGFVLQRVTIYELYDSAVKRVPPFALRKPWFSPTRIQQWEIQQQNYMIAHGKVESRLLLYRNKSTYNTRVFKEMLENA